MNKNIKNIFMIEIKAKNCAVYLRYTKYKATSMPHNFNT